MYHTNTDTELTITVPDSVTLSAVTLLSGQKGRIFNETGDDAAAKLVQFGPTRAGRPTHQISMRGIKNANIGFILSLASLPCIRRI